MIEMWVLEVSSVGGREAQIGIIGSGGGGEGGEMSEMSELVESCGG